VAVSFNAGHKRVVDELLLDVPGVEPGKMFGYPGYYVGGKLFASVFEDRVVVKLPEDKARALLEAGSPAYAPFSPGKHVMRGWVAIERKRSGDYRKDADTLRSGAAYVAELVAQNRPKARRKRAANSG
jgi:TfoX/Sxy family transcriptional regulator of competence genes